MCAEIRYMISTVGYTKEEEEEESKFCGITEYSLVTGNYSRA